MSKTRVIILLILVVVAIAIVGFSAYGIVRFRESSKDLKLGDQAINLGHIEDATIFYEKARNAFPLRPAVSKNLDAIRLVSEVDTLGGERNKMPNKLSIPSTKKLRKTPLMPSLSPTNTPSHIASIAAIPVSNIYVPILMYHHIRINPRPRDRVWAALNVSPENLDAQLHYLSLKDYHTITLDELHQALSNNKFILPPNPIILTFDDGYRSFYTDAYPLLKKYNMKAINFIITEVVGAGAYLTWDQIQEMDKYGTITFGAHTRHHPNLSNLSAYLRIDEIKGSKTDLEKKLHKPINWFAYPYGSYNQQIVDEVTNAGFLGAVSTNYGAIQTNDTAFVIPRIMVDGRYSTDTFSQLLIK